jgi:hypothetical protein
VWEFLAPQVQALNGFNCHHACSWAWKLSQACEHVLQHITVVAVVVLLFVKHASTYCNTSQLWQSSGCCLSSKRTRFATHHSCGSRCVVVVCMCMIALLGRWIFLAYSRCATVALCRQVDLVFPVASRFATVALYRQVDLTR